MMLRSMSRVLAVLLLVGAAALVVAPTPAGAARPGFRCGTQSGGNGKGFPVAITDVRVGRHATFDRFVVQFRGARVPHWRLTPQASAVFITDPRGLRVKLLGRAGLRLVLFPASGFRSYTGPRDFKPRFPQLREARQLGDFEGYVSWGLGLARPSCKRVFTLRAPTRLVIDVPH